MFNKLKKENPSIRFYDVHAPAFQTYGRIVQHMDISEITKVAQGIEKPETGSLYSPSLECFEELSIFESIQKDIFGTMPSQLGYCWGSNDQMNAMEWHKGCELNIAITPLVLILGHLWDIDSVRNHVDASNFVAFFLPAGTVVEIYETTLHFCPCQVNAEGFGCVVGLSKGTNAPLEDKCSDPRLFRKNKWLLAHVDNASLLNKGAVAGIIGENYKIIY